MEILKINDILYFIRGALQIRFEHSDSSHCGGYRKNEIGTSGSFLSKKRERILLYIGSKVHTMSGNYVHDRKRYIYIPIFFLLLFIILILIINIHVSK